MKNNSLNVFAMFLSVGLLLFFSCSSPTSSNTGTQITVNEDITENTVWESGNTYIVDGIVTVQADARLDIQQNVTIQYTTETSEIAVQGTLNAAGSEQDGMVTFTPCKLYADGGAQIGVEGLEGSVLAMEYCEFDGFFIGVKTRKSTANVFNSSFSNCARGMYHVWADSVYVKDCGFYDNDYGVYFERAMHENVERCVVEGCEIEGAEEAGVMVNDQCYIKVYNNLFDMCNVSCSINNKSRTIIVHNTLLNGEVGLHIIRCYEYVEIIENKIDKFDTFIYLNETNPIIKYNNLMLCNGFKLYSYRNPNCTIDAKNNWWNASTSNDILHYIHDKNSANARDDAGVIEFVPFLDKAVKGAGVLD